MYRAWPLIAVFVVAAAVRARRVVRSRPASRSAVQEALTDTQGVTDDGVHAGEGVVYR